MSLELRLSRILFGPGVSLASLCPTLHNVFYMYQRPLFNLFRWVSCCCGAQVFNAINYFPCCSFPGGFHDLHGLTTPHSYRVTEGQRVDGQASDHINVALVRT